MTTSYRPPYESSQSEPPGQAGQGQAAAPTARSGTPGTHPQVYVRRKVTPARPAASSPVSRARPEPLGRAPAAEPPERDSDGHAILHRGPNFYVVTTSRPGRLQAPPPLRQRSGHTALIPRFAPEQEQRISASKTREMPNVTLAKPWQGSATSLPGWAEAVLVVVGLLAAAIAHAYNMFNYPQYSLDEGTYMSSAWAVLHGMLAPYPYGYGHPPLAWIQIAGWAELTGGFFTFGNAINSGRVLMLLFAAGSSLLVYLIFRRMIGSRVGALFAMALFSLSPLCIAYQRLVLLDNVAVFWLLLSLYLIVASDSRLLSIVLAGLAFGISLLSKEVMVLFIPVMIYAVWLHTTKFQRKFTLVAFTYIIVAMGSTFVLLAILKGELFPTGWLPWDHHPHLSFLATYFQQAQRGQSQGSVKDSLVDWMRQDPFLVVGSIAATLFNLIAGWRNRKLLLVALLALSFWVLFLRDGVVFPFYVIPLLPMFAFNIAVAFTVIFRYLSQWLRFKHLQVALLLIMLVGAVVFDVQHSSTIFTENLSGPQTQALLWMRDNIPHNDFVVINSYFYTDMHEEGGEGVGNGAIYPYANIYWNVAYDPEIRDTLLKDNWKRIDYIVTDAPMLYDITHLGGDMTIINTALQHATLVADFRPSKYDAQDAIDIYQVTHQPSPSVVMAAGNTMPLYAVPAEMPVWTARKGFSR